MLEDKKNGHILISAQVSTKIYLILHTIISLPTATCLYSSLTYSEAIHKTTYFVK